MTILGDIRLAFSYPSPGNMVGVGRGGGSEQVIEIAKGER